MVCSGTLPLGYQASELSELCTRAKRTEMGDSQLLLTLARGADSATSGPLARRPGWGLVAEWPLFSGKRKTFIL
eukprot:9482332-Pyramimonas_sp.AAC.2